jgi:hypothetical protein
VRGQKDVPSTQFLAPLAKGNMASEEKICLEINQSKTRIVCGNRLLTKRDEMSNLYRGPSKDASYQVSEEKIKM